VEFELQQLLDSINDSVRGMSINDLKRHVEGKWSAAEILEHLCLTYRGTIKGFERCLEAGRPVAGKPDLKQRMATVAVTQFGYFPRGRPAPEPTVPRGMPAEEVVAEISVRLAAMDELIARAEKKYGSKTLVLDHPVLGPLTARQWRRFHCVHGRHHVRQIRHMRGLG